MSLNLADLTEAVVDAIPDRTALSAAIDRTRTRNTTPPPTGSGITSPRRVSNPATTSDCTCATASNISTRCSAP